MLDKRGEPKVQQLTLKNFYFEDRCIISCVYTLLTSEAQRFWYNSDSTAVSVFEVRIKVHAFERPLLPMNKKENYANDLVNIR